MSLFSKQILLLLSVIGSNYFVPYSYANNTEGPLFDSQALDRFASIDESFNSTSTGLKYRVQRYGAGKRPALSDRVKLHYRGYRQSGEEFDSSFSRGEPTEVGVGDIIQGWSEGLQLMRTGAVYTFYIPPELAFGQIGLRGLIDPGETLVYTVELISVD